MKLYSTAALTAAVLYASVAMSTPADRSFKGPGGAGKLKGSADFGAEGAQMKFCPTADCDAGQRILLKLARLAEVDMSGNIVQSADKFEKTDGSWSTFTTAVVDGVNVTSSTFTAVVKVGSGADEVQVNLTSSIYEKNATALNGDQSIPVLAGSLKFTLAMSPWPFESDDNKLHFGVQLLAKPKGQDKQNVTKTTRGKYNATRSDIDRFDLTEGMFLDAPNQAIIDGVNVDIVANTTTSAGAPLELLWEFPHYTKSLVYDPVVGTSDADAQVESTSSTDTSSSAISMWSASAATASVLAGATALAGFLMM